MTNSPDSATALFPVSDMAVVAARMHAGGLTRDGLLGDDPRALDEIIEADRAALAALGLTPEGVAWKLMHLTETATEALGAPTQRGNVELQANETRGYLACPYGHTGLLGKTVVDARRSDTGQQLRWSELSLHLLLDHGFLGGRGSLYRLEPADLARFLA